ncbi:hypothetical protein VNI00_015023 [Paramarasmius palmivorus]|uniref:Gustatory receptor n=1 Tax=Paramarasmius palmivorus TaxID=297713 RepID=A0AAW0BPU3_9AGAR
MSSEPQGPSLEELLGPFLTVEQVVILPITTLSVMYLVYGIYIVFSGQCIHELVVNRDRPNRRLYLGWTISLFVMITITDAFFTVNYVQQTIYDFNAAKTGDLIPLLDFNLHNSLKTATNGIINPLTILINTTADSMLIHRCFVIWGARKRIGLPLAVLSFLINGVGLSKVIIDTVIVSDTTNEAHYELAMKTNGMESAFFISNAIFNSVLTLMTGNNLAGRIWWISRQARAQMGTEINSKYKTIVSILLESGILYPLAIILYLVVDNTIDSDGLGLLPFNIYVVVHQIAGLAPVLIMVRAQRGKTTESVQQVVSTMNFAGTRMGTNDIISRLEASSQSGSDQDARVEEKVHVV